MLRKICLFLSMIFFMAATPLFSENKTEIICTVRGIAIDSTSLESIPYVTVSISNEASPNVYLKRAAGSQKGNFEVGVAKAGKYLLTLESVGMQKKQLKITVSAGQKKLELGNISLSTARTMLKEVTVSASKPLVKVDLDKITYDIKSDPEATSSTTLDMLRKVPLVTVDGDDKIQVKGSSNFKIYMNGKPSGMTTNNPSEAMKSIPASTIKRIEVITEPGAKYDAEGLGGIINIVTESALIGITGNVRASTDTQGSYNGGLYFSSKVGKFGLTANLNYNTRRSPRSISTSERENLNPQSVRSILQDGWSNSTNKFGYGNLEANYEFDTLNLLSFSINGHLGGGNNNQDSKTSMVGINGDTISAYQQHLISEGNWGGVDMSLDYQRSFKKPDQLFTLSYRFSRTPNTSDNQSDLTGIKNYLSNRQHTSSQAHGDEHTFQADYSEPFNKKHVMEFGAKYIVRINSSTNSYLQENDSTNLWEPIPGRPVNDLNQTQGILGAYGSYTLKLKKFNLRAGLRYEQTWSDVATDTTFRINFQNLVPSVSLSYRFDETSNLRLSYNQRISRPGIWYLNPYVDNSNPNSISQGNPKLNTEINNSFSVNFSNVTPKMTVNMNLYTSFTNNSIERVSRLLNDSVEFSTYKNIGSDQSSGLSMYLNWQPVQFMRINGNGGATYSYMSTNDGTGQKNSGVNYNASLGLQFTINKNFRWSINGGYYSPRISLQGQNSSYYYYSSSLSHDFFKKKLNISLRANNFIEKRRIYYGSMQTPDYKSKYSSSYLASNLGITVMYSFGKMKEQIKKVQKTIENSDVKSGGSGGGGE